MKILIVFLTMMMGLNVPGRAISKEDFLNLSHEERRNFSVIMGTYSSEYAIPREEFLKLPDAVRSAINREKARESCRYAEKNLGKKQKDLDVSILHNLSMPGDVSRYAEDIVNYASIAGFCENRGKRAEYYYRDYLEWKKHELGQPSLWKHSGGDAHPLSNIVSLYSDYDMYKEWDALYADYNEIWWKRYAATECRLRTDAGPDCVERWLENAEDYQAFLADWKNVKQKAKTTKPKPLPVQVQKHEDFYSSNAKKVLGALEYYNNQRVRFMLEKAAKHKNPAVAKKAKEYLDNWDKPAPGIVVSTAPGTGAK